jgi:hypothetical protein
MQPEITAAQSRVHVALGLICLLGGLALMLVSLVSAMFPAPPAHSTWGPIGALFGVATAIAGAFALIYASRARLLDE